MFKLIVLVALCLVVFAECKPAENIASHGINAMSMAGKAIEEGVRTLGAAKTQGLNIAQMGVDTGIGMQTDTIQSMTPRRQK